MSKKEVLGVVLAGMLNLLVYDIGARDFHGISNIYNTIHCERNPGKKENERKIKVTLAVDSDLVVDYGKEKIFNSLENILGAVSKKSKQEFGISFEVNNEFVYTAEESIYGSIRVEEATLKVPKFENELRVVFTKRPISYVKSSDGEVGAILGMAPLNHNICLIYFREDFSDLANTTLHEILHAFGAEHVDDISSLMYFDNSEENPTIDKTTLDSVLHNKNKKFF